MLYCWALLAPAGQSRPRTEAPDLGRAAVHACCNTQLKQSDLPVVWLTVAVQPGCLTPTQSKNVFPISTKGPPKAHLHVQQVAEVCSPGSEHGSAVQPPR